jgi:hypothetical protein
MSTATTSKTPESFEAQLTHLLRFGGIDKENLHELVGIVAKVHQAGLKTIRVFPKGIPPVVDGLQVSGLVEAVNIGTILNNILNQTPRYTGVVIFPYGIPIPEIFQVNVDFSGIQEGGTIQE